MGRVQLCEDCDKVRIKRAGVTRPSKGICPKCHGLATVVIIERNGGKEIEETTKNH